MFHALVGVKQVPDTTNIRIDPETGSLIRQGVPTSSTRTTPMRCRGCCLEEKTRGKSHGNFYGAASCVSTIRECIEMGADRGILISARQFSGADTLATSYVLAEVIRAVHAEDPIDLVLFGKQAIDGDTAQVGPGVSVRLGFPLVTYAVKIHNIDLDACHAVVERKTERANEVLQVKLPLLLTCEKEIEEIPFASLPDLVYSLDYEPEVWTAESPIAFPPELIGLKGSPTTVNKTTTPENIPPERLFRCKP